MGNLKAHLFYHDNLSFIRYDIRVIFSIFLCVYILFAYGQWKHNGSKHKEAAGSLKILSQMQDYAKLHCQVSNIKPPDTNEKHLNRPHRLGVTKETVNNEVTFVLLAPTLRCLDPIIDWVRSRYKKAKILIALNLGIAAVNKMSNIQRATRKSSFLGGFTNIPEALNRAVKLISTQYFIILDHTIGLKSMRNNFVEAFLTNMPGYDILSGSIVNNNGEFSIPCRRLKMERWSYHETYEYNVTGNILRCDAIPLYFIARTHPLKNILRQSGHIFDEKLLLKPTEDFFIRFKNILAVGILPEVLMRLKTPRNCFLLKEPVLPKSELAERTLPFAKKHQLFRVCDDASCIDVCKHSKSLACSERGIQKKWGLMHWADAGLTTYPFIVEALRRALHFGTKRLKELHLTYVIEGGTVLGLVKLRDILPWDHGDIDTFVYATRRQVIDMVKQTFRRYGYEFWLRHSGFHTYVTDDATSWNGCFVYLTRRVKPKALVYMKHRGKFFPVKRNLFQFLRQFYGSLFLENHMKVSNQRSFCMTAGHHACMPDCRWDGCSGGL